MSCPSCNSGYVGRVGAIAACDVFAGQYLKEALRGGYLYRCDACHLFFRWPQLTKEQLDGLYENGNPNHWQYVPERRDDWQIIRSWIKANPKLKSTLDIGCFDGAFQRFLGTGYQHYGIEIQESAARSAQQHGICILASNFDELKNISTKFDAVVALDVIEHVKNPLRLLQMMANATRTGGLTIVSTGNTDAFPWRFMGSRYLYCSIPEHVAFINPRWCRTAAEKCNLTVQHIEKFSHLGIKRTFMLRVSDLAKNTLYKVSPALVGWLRAIGFGGIDVKQRRALRHFPPPWASAKDHFVVIFEKQ